jgi:hypothetical protein
LDADPDRIFPAFFECHEYYQHPIQTRNWDMARLAIEFDWMRDPKGYRLVETGRPKMLRVVRNGKGNSPKDFESCRPLSSTDWLFKIFANTATTPAGVLDFVQRFGSLTWDGWDTKIGDDVSLVISNAEHMHQLLRYSAGNQKRLYLPPNPHQASRVSSIDAQVIWDPANRTPKWELRPKTLLDALWLQFGQAVTAGARIRQCEHCGDWFEAGRGTGRRLDSKFCSDEHRIAFNSLKRSREK